MQTTAIHLKVPADLLERLDRVAGQAHSLPSPLPRKWTRHGLALALIERGLRELEAELAALANAKGADDANLAQG